MERINIFLSSPGDTKQERQIAVEQIRHLAKLHRHYTKHCVFSTFAFTSAVPPEIGDAPQRTVDRYMKASEADIVVCMLRQRMGTPTVDAETGERFQSGTKYQLLTAWRAQQRSGRPRILLYRLQPRTSVEVDRNEDLQGGRVLRALQRPACRPQRAVEGRFVRGRHFAASSSMTWTPC